MATSRWRSSLAGAENRLRRSLGLAGPINSELPDPLPLQPVILVDDATRPGSVIGAGIRGRRWSVPIPAGIVTAAHRALFCMVTDSVTGVIVRRIMISHNQGAGGIFYHIGLAAPGATYPAGATPVTKSGIFTEGMAGQTDLAPILIGTSGAQDALPTVGVNNVWEMLLPNNVTVTYINCDFFLQNGAGLWIASAISTGTTSYGIMGEVY